MRAPASGPGSSSLLQHRLLVRCIASPISSPFENSECYRIGADQTTHILSIAMILASDIHFQTILVLNSASAHRITDGFILRKRAELSPFADP